MVGRRMVKFYDVIMELLLDEYFITTREDVGKGMDLITV